MNGKPESNDILIHYSSIECLFKETLLKLKQDRVGLRLKFKGDLKGLRVVGDGRLGHQDPDQRLRVRLVWKSDQHVLFSGAS